MRLSDQDLLAYVTKKLALPGEERNEHRRQVNRLLDKLEAVLNEDGSYSIKKFRRAGSLEKGTSNRPRTGKPVDADVGVYFDVEDPSEFEVVELQGLIKKLLTAAYPQKDADDFEEGGRTFGVVFKASGLEVDLVPIVSLDDEANFGLQYGRDGDRVKTSVKVHLDHYRDHAALDPFLSPTLRLAKRWAYWQELDGVHSFHFELILSSLVDQYGPAPGLEESLRRFFLFVVRDLQKGIGFNGVDPARLVGAVVIMDPANEDNNVAARIEPLERDELVAKATAAYETITWAQGLPYQGETVAAWKELFGDNFAIEH